MFNFHKLRQFNEIVFLNTFTNGNRSSIIQLEKKLSNKQKILH